jgi:hypothetical protein
MKSEYKSLDAVRQEYNLRLTLLAMLLERELDISKGDISTEFAKAVHQARRDFGLVGKEDSSYSKYIIYFMLGII